MLKSFGHFGCVSAMVLAMAVPALADDNFANVIQAGDDNSALATQGPGSGNDAGTTSIGVRQNGNLNILTFLQSGDDNSIGTVGTGFQQNSNRNTATITQSSNGNKVYEVTQTGISSGNGGATLRRNVLTILQEGGDGNAVGSVTQTRSGSSSFSAANSGSITQNGAGNSVGSLLQNGYAHSAVLTQTGGENRIGSVEQRGSRNMATLTFTGEGNGVSSFQFPNDITGAWGGLVQGRAYQNNDFFGAGFLDGNVLSLTATGTDNSFGFSQTGAANSINGLVGPLGSGGNQTGVVQLGIDNSAGFTVAGSDNLLFIEQGLWPVNISNDANVLVTGDRNQVGARQSGTNNSATVDITTGNDNIVNIAQESLFAGNLAEVTLKGDSNVVTLSQSGGNSADIDIDGDDNVLTSSQTGFDNTLDIELWGSRNNAAVNGGFTSIALTTSQLTSPDLVPGSIVQNGSGNWISYKVGTSLVPSDDNKFAFSQTGSGNGIEGETTGGSNQVVIIQSGSSNFTSFAQHGTGNIISVIQ